LLSPQRRNRTVEKPLPGRLAADRQPHECAPTPRRRLRKLLLHIIVALASCALLVTVSVILIDRPVATWVHEHLGDSRFGWFMASYDNRLLAIGPFSLMAGPSAVLGPVALVVLAITALAAAAGWRPNVRGRIALALSLSVLVAMELNAEMKSIFGRTWPESWLGDNPSWIRDGVFGFHPFHGGAGWGSFSSGHTTVIAAPMTILWVVWPELRVVWAATVAMVVAGLIGANYHFVSDIIGGLYLGAAVGLGIAGLMLSPMDRPTGQSPKSANSRGYLAPLSAEAGPVPGPSSTVPSGK
jgi:membrane-associated phospholipid phosphatase